MRKKDLKKWINKLKRRGVPIHSTKQTPSKVYNAAHLAHMKRDLELK